jgi:hypothetical protein
MFASNEQKGNNNNLLMIEVGNDPCRQEVEEYGKEILSVRDSVTYDDSFVSPKRGSAGTDGNQLPFQQSENAESSYRSNFREVLTSDSDLSINCFFLCGRQLHNDEKLTKLKLKKPKIYNRI